MPMTVWRLTHQLAHGVTRTAIQSRRRHCAHWRTYVRHCRVNMVARAQRRTVGRRLRASVPEHILEIAAKHWLVWFELDRSKHVFTNSEFVYESLIMSGSTECYSLSIDKASKSQQDAEAFCVAGGATIALLEIQEEVDAVIVSFSSAPSDRFLDDATKSVWIDATSSKLRNNCNKLNVEQLHHGRRTNQMVTARVSHCPWLTEWWATRHVTKPHNTPLYARTWFNCAKMEKISTTERRTHVWE